MITYNDYWLAHHGIIGQKWGVWNGPPYPLGSDVSTGHRLKSGASGTAINKEQAKPSPVKKSKKVIDTGIGLKPKTREYTMDEDIAAVNPKYNPKVPDWEQPEWRTNCCYCSVAYEMRRRGYDVKAKPRTDDKKYHELTDWYNNPNEAMFDFKEPRTKAYGFNDLDYKPLKRPRMTGDVSRDVSYARRSIEKMPNGSRGFLTVDWWCGGGHSMMFEKVGDTVFVIDAQTNEKFDMREMSNKFEYFAYIGGVEVTRVDDVDVIPGKIKGACS